jgi:hypothetical protein
VSTITPSRSKMIALVIYKGIGDVDELTFNFCELLQKY